MRTFFLTILFAFSCILFFNSCEEDPKKETTDETAINACGVIDPAKNLPWLAELIEKAKNDNTGNYFGRIWLEKFKEQNIFVTDMMLGSGGIMYYFFDCNGNHLISRQGEGYCPSEFVEDKHFFVENEEDFGVFIQNMKFDIVIYSPF